MSTKGYHHTDETKKNISEGLKRYFASTDPEAAATRAQMRAAKLGKKRKPFSAETKARMRVSQRARRRAEREAAQERAATERETLLKKVMRVFHLTGV